MPGFIHDPLQTINLISVRFFECSRKVNDKAGTAKLDLGIKSVFQFCESGASSNRKSRMVYPGKQQRLNSIFSKDIIGSDYCLRGFVRDESGKSDQARAKARAMAEKAELKTSSTRNVLTSFPL